MRISKYEIKIIKDVIYKYVNELEVEIYLFGSRAFDYKKGGDIDIFIKTDNKISLKDKIKILTDFEIFGIERQVDLVIQDSDTQFEEIFKKALMEGIKL
jgi:predicted nucleotidyltransferase